MSRSSPPSTLITSITNDDGFRLRILSIPDGYHLFRTDSVHSERMQDIRGVSGESIAFHMHLYSSAVFPVLDRTRHQFTSIPHIDFRPAKSHSPYYYTSDNREPLSSSANLLIADRRSCFRMDIIEANECLRSWYGKP